MNLYIYQGINKKMYNPNNKMKIWNINDYIVLQLFYLKNLIDNYEKKQIYSK